MLPSQKLFAASTHSANRKSTTPPSSRPASVTSRRSSHSSSSSTSQGVPDKFRCAQDVFQEVSRILKHETRYLATLQSIIAHSLGPGSTLKKPTACFCLGLGSVNRWHDSTQVRASTVGLAQLAVLVAILDVFGIDRKQTTVYDPCFQDADREFLSFLNFSAPRQAFGTSESEATFPVLSEVTLVYRPGCGVDNIYERNFSKQGLSRIVDLRGAISDANRALGLFPIYKVDGKDARVIGSKSQNERKPFLPVVDATLAQRKEPIRRAAIISDQVHLPAISDFLRDDIKPNKPGAHLRFINRETIDYAVGQTLALSWIPYARSRMMPPAFWNLQPMKVGMLGRVEVELSTSTSA